MGSHSSTTSKERPRHRWNKGYHFGIFCCALTAAIVLIVNVILTIVMAAKNHGSAGTAVLQDGECDETKRLDLWLHLLINVLSTLLLGVSNYSMQCLAAPTRKDIDNAHRQGASMDIGVFSIRNTSRIAWPRKLLWSCLFVSSIPLHLLYNSVVFSSTSLSDWQAFGVTSDFLAGAPFNVTSGEGDVDDDGAPRNYTIARLNKLQTSSSLVRLENQACITTYTAGPVSAWGDLLMVTDQQSNGNSYLQVQGEEFCQFSAPCDTGTVPDPAGNWTIQYSTTMNAVSHCMAAKAQEHCKIQLYTSFAVAVVACNLIKVTCMAIMVWRMEPSPPVTIGDAIASFLDAPGA